MSQEPITRGVSTPLAGRVMEKDLVGRGLNYTYLRNTSCCSPSLVPRLPFDSWDADPLQRYNFWNTFLGQLFVWISLLGVNQPAVQRLLSLPTLKQATL